MTTTFNPAIRPIASPPRRRPAIIAALFAALAVLGTLAGCGVAIRFGYGQAPALVFNWIDGYVDFDSNQELRVRTGLDDFFAWHRRTQLIDYAALLARAQLEAANDTTPEGLCAWNRELRLRIDAAVERALPTMAEVMPTMTATQIGNVEKKNATRNEEYRADFLQKDPAKRRRAAVQREIERAETFYGRLDAGQRERVARAVEASPFVAETAYAERLLRQQDLLATMRRLQAMGTTRGDAEAAIRAYAERIERSPREEYRRYVQRLTEHNCGFAAQLHNSTSAEQRRHLARKLKGWEDDLRVLAADAG